ncbi:MAG: FAD-dependent oxidoreductase [Cyclobacteriaceae bacterium]|nr:FAD-dependent oxidoreductase [Cyclobacteriaceae bacterium]
MIRENFTNGRKTKQTDITADLVVVGGGMSGVCCAITAAREGTKVVLIQDRPVLGGNASSEVRLWILGATSHMGNNNRWAREGGVIDEILVENLYRNKEGNPLILDTILLEKVVSETNITLLLNTAVYEIEKKGDREISAIIAYCSQNSTSYHINGKLFCDASGDGIVGFLSGAAFRMGAESAEEFGEKFVPEQSYGELLGHTLYFYSKVADEPVKYTPPEFALKDIQQIPRYKVLCQKEFGCRLWWIEYGGRKDTVHDTEEIKWELWKVVYGIWDYIKNSGEFEDTEKLTLEWVGTIPGKRESRRFEGLYMLRQQDIVEQRYFEDAVAFGGWAIDLHPADGIYSSEPGCNQWHTKGIYSIPLRAFISKDIQNLFFAGRIISASHVAFGSSRVMATCAHGAQAVGMAAAFALEENCLPADLLEPGRIKTLQNRLNVRGQSIPGIPYQKDNNLVPMAEIVPSSTCEIEEFPFDGPWMHLKQGTAQMLPMQKGVKYRFSFSIKASEATQLTCDLRCANKPENYTPDLIIESQEIELVEGEQVIEIAFNQGLPAGQYGFITFLANDKIWIKSSEHRMTGVVSVFNKVNRAVSNFGKQSPPDHIGVETFEFWTPERRPGGHNIAMTIAPALKPYHVDFLKNGFTRPSRCSNAWVADPKDPSPRVELRWPEQVEIKKLTLFFDTDFDHPMESSLMGHPESVIPFCVRNISLKNCNEQEIFRVSGNYQTIREIVFVEPVKTAGLKIDLAHPADNIPAGLFGVICE